MTAPIPLNLAVEDALTESLYGKILQSIPKNYAIRTIYNQGGFGYLRKNIAGFNNAAKGIPFLVGTDLDRHECPLALMGEWGLNDRHPNLLLRVAVRSAESWILADRENFAEFLGIRLVLLPMDVESLPDAKRSLIDLARKSRRSNVRHDICPPLNSTRKVGPNFNGQLSSFVHQHWDPANARKRSTSLARTVERLATFLPTWQR